MLTDTAMKEMLTDNEGRVVPNFVGKYENLQPDFDRLFDILGRERVKLPKVNRTTEDSYSLFLNESAWSQASINAVRDLYGEDFKIFGYSDRLSDAL